MNTLRITLIATAFATLLPVSLRAQTPADSVGEPEMFEYKTEKTKVSGGMGFFHPAYHMYSPAALNTALTPAGLPAYADNGLGLGGSGMAIIRNFILGGEGAGILAQEVNSGIKTSRYDASWGAFNLGYVAWERKGLMLYPKVGIGSWKQEVFLRTDSVPGTFGSIVSNASTATEMERTGMMLTGELNFNWMPGFDETSGGGVIIGLGVGYRYQATAKSWTVWGNEVSGGPDLNMSGLYFKLNIGAGGYGRQ